MDASWELIDQAVSLRNKVDSGFDVELRDMSIALWFSCHFYIPTTSVSSSLIICRNLKQFALNI